MDACVWVVCGSICDASANPESKQREREFMPVCMGLPCVCGREWQCVWCGVYHSVCDVENQPERGEKRRKKS